LFGAEESKDAVETAEKLDRSLTDPKAKKLKDDYLRSCSPQTSEQELRFPGGINIALKGERLQRITDKLVRGWWYLLTKGQKLPSSHSIMKYVSGDNPLDSEILAYNETQIRQCRGFGVGDNAFFVQLAFEDANQLTCWRFVFYGVFEIIAYTTIDLGETFQVIDLTKPYRQIHKN
jgi:hypothetical protein